MNYSRRHLQANEVSRLVESSSRWSFVGEDRKYLAVLLLSQHKVAVSPDEFTFVLLSWRFPLYQVITELGREPVLSQVISYRLSATKDAGGFFMSTVSGFTGNETREKA